MEGDQTHGKEDIAELISGSRENSEVALAIRHFRPVPTAEVPDELWTSIIIIGCHLQSVTLRLVVIDPELRFLFCQHVRNALH